ncbi:MAG: hypothetical protein IIA54_04475, partial [Chloroflexi bacterium]|nr:hypothetical protein [Chloroflexota bacterium]
MGQLPILIPLPLLVMALVVPVLLALGTNIVGLAGWSFLESNANPFCWAVLGDLRYAPFLSKFVTFEAMTFGIALYVGLLLLVTTALRRGGRAEFLWSPLVLVAIAGLYPNLFPAAGLVLAALIATLLFAPGCLEHRPTPRLLSVLITLTIL